MRSSSPAPSRTGTRRRTGLAVGAAAALTLTAAACAGTQSSSAPGSAAGPITIGMSLPLSGPVADNSKNGYQGYQLWAAQVNAHGGLLGRQVKLVVLAHGCQQSTTMP